MERFDSTRNMDLQPTRFPSIHHSVSRSNGGHREFSPSSLSHDHSSVPSILFGMQTLESRLAGLRLSDSNNTRHDDDSAVNNLNYQNSNGVRHEFSPYPMNGTVNGRIDHQPNSSIQNNYVQGISTNSISGSQNDLTGLYISDYRNTRHHNNDSAVNNLSHQSSNGVRHEFSPYPMNRTANGRIDNQPNSSFRNNFPQGIPRNSIYGSHNDLSEASSPLSSFSRNTWGSSEGNFASLVRQRGSLNDAVYPQRHVIIQQWAGNMLSMAKSEEYSCQLQDFIAIDSLREEIDMIFNELVPNVCELMVHHLGHCVVQKLLKGCSHSQISLVLLQVASNCLQLLSICTNCYGRRAMKTLLRSLRSEEQVSSLVGALSAVAVPLTKSFYGRHVIQYCLTQFSPRRYMCLLEMIANQSCEIAEDQYGCKVLQLCISCSDGELSYRLIWPIIRNAKRLSEHAYGNYVIQFLLELRDLSITAEILKQLKGNYVSLSRHKCGSHVVEECLRLSGEEQSRNIVVELLKDIDMLCIDAYGNYVIQLAVKISKDYVRQTLQFHLEKNSGLMRNNIYGRKALVRLNNLRRPHPPVSTSSVRNVQRP